MARSCTFSLEVRRRGSTPGIGTLTLVRGPVEVKAEAKDRLIKAALAGVMTDKKIRRAKAKGCTPMGETGNLFSLRPARTRSSFSET